MHCLSTLALAGGLLLTGVAPPPSAPSGPGNNSNTGFPEPAQPPVSGSPITDPYPNPQASVAPSTSRQMLARAKSWFAQLQAGKIDRSQLAPNMASLTDEQVANVSAQIKQLGTPVTFELQQTMQQGGNAFALYLLTFGDGKKLDFIFAIDGQGKVAGLRLQPDTP
jgi:hypothetical protein